MLNFNRIKMIIKLKDFRKSLNFTEFFVTVALLFRLNPGAISHVLRLILQVQILINQ